MPSHPERVRRNYHKIIIGHKKEISTDDDIIYIRISRKAIASAMSAREIYYNVVRAIKNSIFERWN